VKLLGNDDESVASLIERGRDVVTRQGLGRRRALIQRREDVALGEVGLGADAVELTPCR
jgi:hypothetical protein